jgi:hypothetical protein
VRTAVSRQLSAISFGIALVIAGCAASHSGPSKIQHEYVKAHPLSPDEQRRLYAREAKAGDTLDRVRVTFDDCEFYRRSVEGELSVWGVRVPMEARPVRLNLEKLEEIGPGGSALLTFEHDRLKTAIVLE